jgi:hypothetical protein
LFVMPEMGTVACGLAGVIVYLVAR